MSTKYYTWYNAIVNHRMKNPLEDDAYREVHHIIPKSLNGSNDRDNLVALSAREHFICHYLLTKIYPVGSNEWYKMQHAFMMMAADKHGKRYFNARLYEACRHRFSVTMSRNQIGDKNSQFGKIWITNLSLERNQKVCTEELEHWLSIGWTRGRIYDFNKAKQPIVDKRELAKELAKQEARTLFDNYLKSDCVSVREYTEKSNYQFSYVSLTILWRKYIPEYHTHVKPGKLKS